MRSVVLLGLFLVACGSDGGTADDAGTSSDAPVTKDSAVNDTGAPKDGSPGPDGSVSGTTTIFTIVFENHNYDEVVGSANAPYFNSLIASYGLATNYMDSGTHPSLPNYLTMASGAAQYPGILDVDPTAGPYFPAKVPNLGEQLETAKVGWRAYGESMGTPCKLAGAGTYAPKHVPFLYFDGIQNGASALCASRVVDYTSFAADVAGGTYRYMFIAPNLTSDGHDPANDPVASMKTSDAWAKTAVDAIMATAAYKNGGIIFITWDEGEVVNLKYSDQVPMIIVSPRIKAAGFKSAKKYSHKSYLATVEDLLSLPRLATVTNEPNMMEFFK